MLSKGDKSYNKSHNLGISSTTSLTSPPSSSPSNLSLLLSSYRNQLTKDYTLLIEYKHLKNHLPNGIYILPSFHSTRIWYGAIFLQKSYYKNGIFKFRIHIPENYNNKDTYPRVIFTTPLFHPLVDPYTNELYLKHKFPTWDPELHYMVSVLVYIKSIFYMKEFESTMKCVYPDALALYSKNKEKYMNEVDLCVKLSHEVAYENEDESSLKFSKPIPAHEDIKRRLEELRQQMGRKNLNKRRKEEQDDIQDDEENLEEKNKNEQTMNDENKEDSTCVISIEKINFD